MTRRNLFQELPQYLPELPGGLLNSTGGAHTEGSRSINVFAIRRVFSSRELLAVTVPMTAIDDLARCNNCNCGISPIDKELSTLHGLQRSRTHIDNQIITDYLFPLDTLDVPHPSLFPSTRIAAIRANET